MCPRSWLNQKKPHRNRFPSLSVHWTPLQRLVQIGLSRMTCHLSFCPCFSLSPVSLLLWAKGSPPVQPQSARAIARRSRIQLTKPTPLTFSFLRAGCCSQMGFVSDHHFNISDQSPGFVVRIELH